MTCIHCGSDAVVAGVCASCSRRQETPAEAVQRRKRRTCKHRQMVTVGAEGPYAGRRREKCAGCGVERVVEA